MAKMTALEATDARERFHIELRPAIHEGNVLSSAVALKMLTVFGLAKLTAFCDLMGLTERTIIEGKRYNIALVPLKAFNAASADVPEPTFTEEDETEEENEESEEEPEEEDQPEA